MARDEGDKVVLLRDLVLALTPLTFDLERFDQGGQGSRRVRGNVARVCRAFYDR